MIEAGDLRKKTGDTNPFPPTMRNGTPSCSPESENNPPNYKKQARDFF
jgi:hypothetical protein